RLSKRAVMSYPVVAAVLAAAFWLWWQPSASNVVLTGEIAVTPQSIAKIEATDPVVERRAGFLSLVGEVTNISSSALSNTIVQVRLYNRDRKLTSIENAPLEASLLRPGGTAAYQVVIRGTANIKEFRIYFLSPGGNAIPTRQAPTLN